MSAHDDAVMVPAFFDLNGTDEGAELGKSELAQIRAATAGIQSVAAILARREADMHSNGEGRLTIGSYTVAGLIDAISCCAELIGMTLDRSTTSTAAAQLPEG